MDFGFYYRPEGNRVLFHFRPDDPAASPCCYDTLVSESRIVDYLGIAKGELPRQVYYGRWRTFPDSCDYSFQETRPTGSYRSLDGIDVFEGSYPYNDTRLVPSWGGSMFEALMPALFVPEERWGPGSWRANHPLTVDAQIDHGLNVAQYGSWGFSPSNVPEGGYGGYGVDAAGMNPDGMPSNEDKTLVDRGFPGCPDRAAKADPPASAYTNGVVTPHAAFLALRYRPRAALANLARLEAIPGVYGRWGFADSVNVDTGIPSPAYLSLDQGMIMAALGNALGGDVLRDAFATPDLRRAVRPVIGVEEFAVAPRGCTISGSRRGDRLRGTAGDDVICAAAVTIGSWAAAVRTPSTATGATTAWAAVPVTTRSTATRATTGCAATAAPTCSPPALAGTGLRAARQRPCRRWRGPRQLCRRRGRRPARRLLNAPRAGNRTGSCAPVRYHRCSRWPSHSRSPSSSSATRRAPRR